MASPKGRASPQQVPTPVRPEPEQLQQFLDQAAEEITIRREEVRLRQREMERGYDYAEQNLQATERDRSKEREERRKARRDILIAALLVFILFAGFMLYLFHIGKDGFAGEVLKAVVFLLSGGTGGYFAGKQQAEKNTPKG